MKILFLLIVSATIICAFALPKKHKADFKSTMESFESAVTNAKAAFDTHGDTLSAYNALHDAYDNLDAFDVNHEMENAKNIWPLQAAYCSGGCAQWYYWCIHPYPGIEAVGNCLHGWEQCIRHCYQ